MRRREFIAVFAGAAVGPVVARAQQPAVPVVGCLVNGSSTGSDDAIVPFATAWKTPAMSKDAI